MLGQNVKKAVGSCWQITLPTRPAKFMLAGFGQSRVILLQEHTMYTEKYSYTGVDKPIWF